MCPAPKVHQRNGLHSLVLRLVRLKTLSNEEEEDPAVGHALRSTSHVRSYPKSSSFGSPTTKHSPIRSLQVHSRVGSQSFNLKERLQLCPSLFPSHCFLPLVIALSISVMQTLAGLDYIRPIFAMQPCK